MSNAARARFGDHETPLEETTLPPAAVAASRASPPVATEAERGPYNWGRVWRRVGSVAIALVAVALLLAAPAVPLPEAGVAYNRLWLAIAGWVAVLLAVYVWDDDAKEARQRVLGFGLWALDFRGLR